ncbi:MAG TPA: hypothetical protein VGY66_17765 [Gemmataceae bacterium]|jgi:hypothetical protein|nr:hypothetical protein [Gemmataceae bacterium]
MEFQGQVSKEKWGKFPDDLTIIASKDVRERPGEKYFSLEP